MWISSLSGSALKSPHTIGGNARGRPAATISQRARTCSWRTALSSCRQFRWVECTWTGSNGASTVARTTRRCSSWATWPLGRGIDSVSLIDQRDTTALPNPTPSSSSRWSTATWKPRASAMWWALDVPSATHTSWSAAMSGSSRRMVSTMAGSRSSHGPNRHHRFQLSTDMVVGPGTRRTLRPASVNRC
jgi:hypothetical protein